MCGIAGLVSAAGPVATDQLHVMAERLAHRGPDDRGVYVDGQFGLAHTRLSIIDLQGGHQPLYNAAKTLVLVVNGEIYNYIELRRELEARGHRFLSHSDSEVVLHGYAEYGLEILPRLCGMFAFALYDRERRRLVLARDRLGMKPLFIARTAGGLAFASEIKALLPVLPRGPEINPGALLQFLQNQFTTGAETIVGGVARLAPAEAQVIDAQLNVERRRYWSALAIRPRRVTFAAASAEFDGIMETVMREHMRSDVPYGVFLSGGVDSAIVLAMLARYQGEAIRSYSVGFKDVAMKDELSDAERIARLFNTDHTPLALDRNEVFNRLPHTIWAADDLMRDYACLPTAILAERAGRELKVVLTGEGGDEVFAGYGRYRRTPVQRWLKNLLAPGSGGFRTRGHWRRRWSRRLFGAALRSAADAQRAPFVAAWREAPADWSDMQRSQYVDLVTALPDDLLVKVDRMLMAFGVEGRVPFLDHRVVEFGLALPDELRVAGRQGKVFLKRWAERFLPGDHLYRRKRGFYVPVGEWLTGGFLDALAAKLPANPALRQWFDADGMRALIAYQRSGGNASREIWCLMQFAIWHRLFIERPGSRPAAVEDPLDWIA